MNPKFQLASSAALIADPARAAMLIALLDARPRSAGELALVANVSAQSGSMHLSQLLAGGFLNVTRQGRHRYYSIAGPHIAHAVEAMGAVSTPLKLKPRIFDHDLRYARTCYDHLAGQLAVHLTEAFERRRILLPVADNEYQVTRDGEKFLAAWRIDASTLRSKRRTLARRCLDWTERRNHVAGALGAALCEMFLERRWIMRKNNSRIVHLSLAGRRELGELLTGLA